MKRILTLAFGIGLGAAGAYLAARGLRRARRQLPQAIADGARTRFAGMRGMFEDAIGEGRRAMNQRESELRQGAPPAGH